ncbi:hypothetical protein CspeluHIS016_0104880 [Cutaneotrichosporon spelunceum]|uniref:Polysaccharide lyase 14 domain-containing protein n=1 Tax=Cutaneotrichosporon spelunceum TaxID=1672016 RepID=A0AAD3Y9K5_9TREE|nr:hypothetical protein CspeluHIS016_0104880 [Cutaneotrichosporon spelunceum]
MRLGSQKYSTRHWRSGSFGLGGVPSPVEHPRDFKFVVRTTFLSFTLCPSFHSILFTFPSSPIFRLNFFKMRFQLLSVLAILASVSVEASQPEVRGVANQAGPAGVARSFEQPHNNIRRSRSRRSKRKTCRARPGAPAPSKSSGPGDSNSFVADKEGVSSDSVSVPSSASGSTSPSASASSSASSDGSSKEDAFEEAEASSASSVPSKPAPTSSGKGGVNTAEKVLAGDVDKWIGTLAPEQGPVGSALQTFTTGGGGSGVTMIDNSGSTTSGSFDSMTIEGNNPGLKTAYGLARFDGNSATFTYRKGQVGDNNSWFWYTTADPGNTGMDLTTARTASFTYTVKFSDGFDWKLGGKLPGWYGGDSADAGKHCTGHAGSASCFTSRLMWRPDGVGEVYNYYWGSKQAYCSDPSTYKVGQSEVICHSGSGDSLGRGSFKFEAGKPITITNTITLNTMSGSTPNADGRQVLVVDGVKVIEANNLIARHHDAGRIRGLFFSTFFGGSGSSWACPKDQEVTFSDVSVSILEKL